MAITDGNGIDGSTIHTHPLRLIRFRHKNDENGTRAKAFADVPFGEEILNLAVDLLGLFRVGAVGGTVWERSAGYEVDAVFYASEWW